MTSSKTALIVVDIQNDFVDPQGSISVHGATSVIPNINAMIAVAQSQGSLVVYTQDWHPEVTSHFAKDGGIWPVHCVAETWGAQFYPELNVAPGAEIVRKGVGGEDGYSGFSMRDPKTESESDTLMDSTLRKHVIEKVHIVGIATDYCVKDTAIDACRRGFKTVVYRNCIKGVEIRPGDSQTAIKAMVNAGAEVRDS